MSDENNITPIEPYRNGRIPEEPRQPGEPKKRAPSRWKLVVWIAAAVLLIALVGFLIFRDRLSVNLLRNAASEGSVLYQYDDGSGNAYASCRNALVTATGSGLTAFDSAGNELGTVQHSFATPILMAGKDLTVCGDIGGNRLSAINQKGVAALDLETDGTILDVSISAGDYICDAEQVKGYKTVLTVYDDKQNQIYRWYSASQYLNQCAISENGKYLCAAGLKSSSNSFESEAVLFDTSREEPLARVSLGSQLIWDMRFQSATNICAIGEKQLICLNTSGTVLGTYDYGDRYVTDYCVGSSFAALAVNQYQAGERFSVVTVDASGNQIAEQYLGEEILSLTTAGGKCAVLTTSHLYVYDKNLNLLSSTEDTAAASSAVMQEDGSVILLSGGTGTLYLSK